MYVCFFRFIVIPKIVLYVTVLLLLHHFTCISSFVITSPHIVFLSQSVLDTGSPASGGGSLSLCGSRICHEIAHSWFGLVIGARDWTEEWISEGFATCLEDTIWAQAQQVRCVYVSKCFHPWSIEISIAPN